MASGMETCVMITQAHCPKNSKWEGRKLACPLIKVLMNHMEMLATKRNVTICRPGLGKTNFHYDFLKTSLLGKYEVLPGSLPDSFPVKKTYFSLTCVAPLQRRQQAFKMNKVCVETWTKLRVSATSASRAPVRTIQIEFWSLLINLPNSTWQVVL